MLRTARTSHHLLAAVPSLLLAVLLALAPPAGAQQTDFLFSTYLGGISYDQGADIAVDIYGYAWATGFTYDRGFPGAGEPPTPEEGYEHIAINGFAAAFHSSGYVPFTTYIGGGFNELLHAAAAGISGVWLAGEGTDNPALLVHPEGSPISLPSALLSILDVAVDAIGDVYITGSTWASGPYVMS